MWRAGGSVSDGVFGLQATPSALIGEVGRSEQEMSRSIPCSSKAIEYLRLSRGKGRNVSVVWTALLSVDRKDVNGRSTESSSCERFRAKTGI
jgi:hypothetical protein